MNRLLPIVLALLLAAPAAAQDGRALGVREAVELAEAQNPALGALRQQLALKRGEWLGGFGLAAPELVFAREGIGDGTFSEQRIGLGQTFDFPLTTRYRLGRLDAEHDALALRVDAAAARVRADVKKAYTDLLYTQELLHLREEEVGLARELLEAATVRVEVGEASGLERMRAEVGLAEAEAGAQEARRAFDEARYALFRAVGLDPDAQRYDLAFPDTLGYVEVAIEQQRVLARLPVQPELVSAERAVAAAELGVRQARSALLPALRLGAFAQDFGDGFTRYGFEVGLQLPLWLYPTHEGRMASARAEVRQRTWERQGVALDLKREVEQAWHAYETSRQTIRRYREVVLGRSAQLLALTQEGYRIGELDLLTLLEAQRAYLATQERYATALRDYYHQLIDLERVLGEELVFTAPAPAVASR